MGLETVEIVLWAEQTFAVDMPDEEVGKIQTVGEFAKYIAAKVNADKGTTINYQDTLVQIIDMLVADYDIKRESINTRSRFIADLGLN